VKKAAQIKKYLKSKWLVPSLTTLIVLIILLLTLVQARHQGSTHVDTPISSQDQLLVQGENISLPLPDSRSGNSIESVLKARRTRLNFTNDSLTLKQVSQLLWAAQGVNTDWGDRTTPSMKSIYPLTIYLLANKVDGLYPGEYQYIPGEREPVHQLKPIKKVELGKALFDLLNQSSFKDIPAVFVVAGDFSKMAEAYGGISHTKELYLEAGFAAGNLSLQAESLKLGTMISTNFDELKLKELVTTTAIDTIIYLMPFGIPKQ